MGADISFFLAFLSFNCLEIGMARVIVCVDTCVVDFDKALVFIVMHLGVIPHRVNAITPLSISLYCFSFLILFILNSIYFTLF